MNISLHCVASSYQFSNHLKCLPLTRSLLKLGSEQPKDRIARMNLKESVVKLSDQESKRSVALWTSDDVSSSKLVQKSDDRHSLRVAHLQWVQDGPLLGRWYKCLSKECTVDSLGGMDLYLDEANTIPGDTSMVAPCLLNLIYLHVFLYMCD